MADAWTTFLEGPDAREIRGRYVEEMILFAYFAPTPVAGAPEVFVRYGRPYGRGAALGVAREFFLAGVEYDGGDPG